MKRLLNIRPDEKGVEQRCEGKQYIWGPGEAMDLPDNVAHWMLKKLNGKDRNEQRERDEGGKVPDMRPWLKEIPIPKGELADAEKGVVRAQHKAKAKPAPQGETPHGGETTASARPVATIATGKPSEVVKSDRPAK